MRSRLPALAIVVTCASAPACGRNVVASSVGAPSAPALVERGDLVEKIVLTGELRAVQSDPLVVPRTRVWMLNIRWMEKEGTRVRKGQRILEFDTSAFTKNLVDQELRALNAAIELSSQAARNRVDSEDKAFQLDEKRLLLDKARLEAKVPKDLQPRRTFQERQLALRRAQVAFDKAQHDAESHAKSAELDMRVKELALEKARRDVVEAESGIDKLVVEAPRDGLLVLAKHPWEGRKFEVGDAVRPGWAILRIPDLSVMEVKASLSDVDDGRIAPGMHAECTLDAHPDRVFEGTIESVSPVAREPRRKSLRRVFEVTVELKETDVETMRPGMSVQAIVAARRADGALIAPRFGLDLNADPPVAILISGERAPIEVGLCTPQACEVTKGLEAGTRLRPTSGSEL